MVKQLLFSCGLLALLLVVSCSETITTTEVREEIVERSIESEKGEREEPLLDDLAEGLNNKAYDLLRIVDEVMQIEEYQPGYPTWHGWHVLGLPKQPGAQPGIGWANAISNEILIRNGCDTDPLLDLHLGKPSISYTTSRDMVSNAIAVSQDSAAEVVELKSLAKIQQLANNGHGIFVTGLSKDAKTVHVAVVVPDEDGFDVENGPLLTDAGAYMDIVSAREWSERREVVTRYFLLRCNN